MSGKLRMGDRILKVNGTDVTSATHQEAVMELLRPCDEIVLTCQHDPLPAGFQVGFQFFSSTQCFNGRGPEKDSTPLKHLIINFK